MPLFNSATLNRIVNQGEINISVEKPFLVDRFEPTIVSGTPLYTLPDYVTSIRRVTYLGFGLDPLPQRNFREVFQNGNQIGKPFWYIFDNQVQNTIRLFPAPPDNIAAGVDPWLADIPTKCIIEFYRVSDNSSFVLPSYVKRQLLKQYAAQQLYKMEGAGQNKKLSQYFTSKYDMFKKGFIEHLDYLHNRPRKFVVNEIVSSNYFPAQPILPIDMFGTGVDEGY